MGHRKLPPLGALKAFEAVGRLASFKAAAAELLVTPTAISHQIRQLEAHLGVRMLDRSPRSVSLTAAGRILHLATTSGFAEIERAAAQVRRGRGHPIVTLSATPAFLSLWLVPRLADLRRVLPALELRLHASDQLAELRAGGVDAAIRYGKPPIVGNDAITLCQDYFAPVCSPALKLRRLADLRKANLIHVDGRVAPRPDPSWPRWCEHAGVLGVGTRSGVRFTDTSHAIQAAIGRQGVAIVSLVLARDALESGLLVQPFPPTLQGDPYHFVCAPAATEPAEIAALRTWFKNALDTRESTRERT
jgi:LysR family glycine cleavage system transcriptional activator